MKALLLTLLLAPALLFAAPTSLENDIAEFIRANQAVPDSGIAVAVIQDGRVLLEKGFGYRDRAAKLPVDARSVFAIASNTKSFTALALAFAQEAGALRFEDPIRKLLPEFALEDPTVAEQMTLTDMLTHRTGLPRHELVWYFTPFTRAELLSRMKYLPLNPRPSQGFRRAWQYNNLMYLAAGLALERATGTRWEEEITRKILKPLGMSETDFVIANAARGNDFAKPYLGDKELPPKNMESIGPAGSMDSNLRDMEKWVAFFLNHGVTDRGERLIGQAALERLWIPGIEFGIYGVPAGYADGWFVTEIDGKKLVWNGGNVDGYSSHVSYMPSEGLGVVVLTNQNSASAMEFPIKTTVSGHPYVGLPYFIYDKLLHPNAARAKAGKVAPLPFLLDQPGAVTVPVRATDPEPYSPADYAGTFTHPGYGEVKLREQGGVLSLDYYGHEATLTQIAADVFVASATSADLATTTLAVVFSREAGKVSSVGITFEPSVAPIRFTRSFSARL